MKVLVAMKLKPLRDEPFDPLRNASAFGCTTSLANRFGADALPEIAGMSRNLVPELRRHAGNRPWRFPEARFWTIVRRSF
jgi:hypothetical protein